MFLSIRLVATREKKYNPIVAAHEDSSSDSLSINIINATNETALMIDGSIYQVEEAFIFILLPMNHILASVFSKELYYSLRLHIFIDSESCRICFEQVSFGVVIIVGTKRMITIYQMFMALKIKKI